MAINTAVIMAAGLGTRFGKYTEKVPKGFIKCGDVSMVERSINTLIDSGITRIVIGTGYHKEMYEALQSVYPEVECVFSPRYAETNSMYTLYNCHEAIGDDDFVLLESDLVFEKKAITSLLDCPEPDVMLISPVTKFQDQYYVEYGRGHHLTNCSTDKTLLNAKGELVGIHKLSSQFYHLMCDDYTRKLVDNLKLGYEYQLLYMSRNIRKVYVLIVDGLKWYEIDDPDDLDYAEKHILKYL